MCQDRVKLWCHVSFNDIEQCIHYLAQQWVADLIWWCTIHILCLFTDWEQVVIDEFGIDSYSSCRRRSRKSWRDNIKEWTGQSMSLMTEVDEQSSQAMHLSEYPQRILGVTGISYLVTRTLLILRGQLAPNFNWTLCWWFIIFPYKEVLVFAYKTGTQCWTVNRD